MARLRDEQAGELRQAYSQVTELFDEVEDLNLSDVAGYDFTADVRRASGELEEIMDAIREAAEDHRVRL